MTYNHKSKTAPQRIRLNLIGFAMANGEPDKEVLLSGVLAKNIYHDLRISPARKYFAHNCQCLHIKEVVYQDEEEKYTQLRLNYPSLGRHVPPRQITRNVGDLVRSS